MADDPLVKAISGLTLVTQKMADEQEKEVEAAEKARKERIKELNDIDKEQNIQFDVNFLLEYICFQASSGDISKISILFFRSLKDLTL